MTGSRAIWRGLGGVDLSVMNSRRILLLLMTPVLNPATTTS